MACYLGIVVIAASIRRELGDDELILRRHRAISSSRGAITDVAGRRDAAIAVAGVGDEEAAIGGELGVERNAHQTSTRSVRSRNNRLSSLICRVPPDRPLAGTDASKILPSWVDRKTRAEPSGCGAMLL